MRVQKPKNGENARKRQNVDTIQMQYSNAEANVSRLQEELAKAIDERDKFKQDLAIAQKDAMELHDESTAEIEANIQQIDDINRKVRTNLDKEKAEEDAKEIRQQYNALSVEIEDVRKQKRDLLTNADLPLEGLSVEDGELLYLGQRWDNISGSQQLQVATAIVRKLKPECGFVLIDKLEQMDQVTLQEFGEWLKREGLQAIATRVSTGNECSIVIEDGYSVENEQHQQVQAKPAWEGRF